MKIYTEEKLKNKKELLENLKKYINEISDEKIKFQDLKKYIKTGNEKINNTEIFNLIKELDFNDIEVLLEKLNGYKNKFNRQLISFIAYFYENDKGNIPENYYYNFNQYFILDNPMFNVNKDYKNALLNVFFIKNSKLKDIVEESSKIYNKQIIPIIATEIEEGNLKLDKSYNFYNLKDKSFTKEEEKIISDYFQNLYEANKEKDDLTSVLKKEDAEKVLNFLKEHPGYLSDKTWREHYEGKNNTKINVNGAEIRKDTVIERFPEVFEKYIKENLIPSYKINYTIDYLRKNFNSLKGFDIDDLIVNNKWFASYNDVKDILKEGGKLLKEITGNIKLNKLVKNFYLNIDEKRKMFMKNFDIYVNMINNLELDEKEIEILKNKFNNIRKVLENDNPLIKTITERDFELNNPLNNNGIKQELKDILDFTKKPTHQDNNLELS